MATIAVSTAVGWVVSPIMKMLVEKATSYVAGQYSWSSNIKDDLNKLEHYLTQIQLVVGVAEERRIIRQDQVRLLHKIRDVVYEADDVMDEFEYMLLKAEVERKRIVTRITSSSLSFGKHLVGYDKFGPKLKEVVKKLKGFKASADVLLQVMRIEENNIVIRRPKIEEWCVTSSVSHEEVVGREKERDELVGWLVESSNIPNPCEKNYPVVISMVGGGGMGKTTLAQTIYNDERVIKTFDLRMWVDVSENYEKSELAKKILVAATDNKNINLITDYSFDTVQSELRKVLVSKKFLLVLDDVWYDKNMEEEHCKQMWSEIFAILRNGNVLVTTRMGSVANMLGSTASYPLEGLDKNDSWSLFSRYAFGFENPDNHPELKRIGEQILEILQGSALAIKVVAGQLNATSFDVEEWECVLKNDLSKANDFMAILRLSYENLPEHLQRCFAYCSLFPKNWNLNSEQLVHMWIAQGFVHLRRGDGSSLERIGRDYFNELLSRSFFQAVRRGDKIFYIMHDLMNDLAVHVSEDECFRVEDDDFELPCSIRHLSITNRKLYLLGEHDIGLGRLRSLIILDDCSVCSKVHLDKNVFKKIKSVRVLDLRGSCLDRVPDNIDRLVHLRYFSLKRTNHSLSKSVYNLYHLQVLTILYHSCCFLGAFAFSGSVQNLKSLLHVHVDGAYAITLDKKNQPSCLRAGGVFHINKKKTSNLVQLKDMNKLEGKLSIVSLENVESIDDVCQAKLDCKDGIKELELELEWKRSLWLQKVMKSTRVAQKDLDVIERLRPPSGIETLVIKQFHGNKCPQWLGSNWLKRVQTIRLYGFLYLEELPALGQLPFLKDLKIANMSSLIRIGAEFYGTGTFPSLEILCLEDLNCLQEVLDVVGTQLFPKIRQLHIICCIELVKFPPLPLGIEHVSISRRTSSRYDHDFTDFLHYVNDNSIPSRPLFGFKGSNLTFLDFLHVHHLEAFEVLDFQFKDDVSMKKGLQLVRSQKFLKHLSISGCIREENREWITVFPKSLQYLKLIKCKIDYNLISSSLESLSSSLRHLIMDSCEVVGMPSSPSIFTLPSFTKLEEMEIRWCGQSISIPSVENYPALENLCLVYPTGNMLPIRHNLTRLKHIRVQGHGTDFETLDLNYLPVLEKVQLSDFPALKTLISCGLSVRLTSIWLYGCPQILTLEFLQDLLSLTQLYINRCDKFEVLPNMDCLYSLYKLTIKYCGEFKSFPKTGLPVSLEVLELYRCHPTLHKQLDQKKGREWNKVSAIFLNGLSECTREKDYFYMKKNVRKMPAEVDQWRRIF